jgi:hypothetical protein
MAMKASYRVGLILVALVVTAVVVAVSAGNRQPTAVPPALEPVGLLGKNEDDVRAAWGEPHSFTEFEGDPVWRYVDFACQNAIMLQMTDGEVSHIYRWDRMRQYEVLPETHFSK